MASGTTSYTKHWHQRYIHWPPAHQHPPAISVSYKAAVKPIIHEMDHCTALGPCSQAHYTPRTSPVAHMYAPLLALFIMLLDHFNDHRISKRSVPAAGGRVNALHVPAYNTP